MPNGSYGVESVSGLFRTNRAFSHAALTEEVREVPFEHLMSEPVDPPRRAQRASTSTRASGFLAEELGLHSVVFGTGDVAWLDIGPKGVSKATMLARLCDRLGLDPALTMAVGDSMNDIEMLKWAGVGVLMGHAVPEMHAVRRRHHRPRARPRRGRGTGRHQGLAASVYAAYTRRMAATTIKVSTELRDRINAVAEEQGLTAGSMVEKLLEDWLWRQQVELAKQQMRSMTHGGVGRVPGRGAGVGRRAR